MSILMMAAASMMMSQNAAIHRVINEDREKHKEPDKVISNIPNDGFTPSPESFKVKGYANMVLVQALEHLNYSSNKDIKP